MEKDIIVVLNSVEKIISSEVSLYNSTYNMIVPIVQNGYKREILINIKSWIVGPRINMFGGEII